MSSLAQQTMNPSAPVRSDQAAEVDVCLLLEGTWPYVRGGVSTWVHQILTALPDIRFAVVFIGAEKDSIGERKYDSPPNLVSLTELFLFDPANLPPGEASRISRQTWKEAHSALELLLIPEDHVDADSLDARLSSAFLAIAKLAEGVTFDQFWSHPETWQLLQFCYSRYFDKVSFIDFFWNTRFLIRPVWRLLRIEKSLPEAAVYHSVSTGYAGLLGGLAARHRPNSQFLLSEHGIYVRERISDLLRSEWSELSSSAVVGDSGIPPLRQIWIDFFIEIGRFSYHSAARIVSLFQKNAAIQIEFGAPPELQLVIPNGVDLARFIPIREARLEKRVANPTRQNVGFYGRVVAIKDVKTLLRAAQLTVKSVPAVQFFIVGPTDEDSEYFEECQKLAKELGIENHVQFTGPSPPDVALPEFDLMVLSSVSEGLPFAVLEAFATGMPVVSTDVGSCSELIYGRDGESPAFGSAGRIVPTGNPATLARALVEFLNDRALQDQCGAAGLARTEALYSESGVISDYHDLYQSLISNRNPDLTS